MVSHRGKPEGRKILSSGHYYPLGSKTCSKYGETVTMTASLGMFVYKSEGIMLEILDVSI